MTEELASGILDDVPEIRVARKIAASIALLCAIMSTWV